MLWHHRRMKSLVVLVVALLAAILPTPGASAEPDTPRVRLLIQDGTALDGLDAAATGDAMGGWRRVEVPLSGSETETARALATRIGRPVVVERSYGLLAPQDEPSFNSQWSLENSGQSGGTVDADIDAIEAWGISTGAGSVVAIVDSGVQATHPELDGQIWVNENEILNGLDDDGNGYVDDTVGWDFIDRDNDPSPVGTGSDDAHATLVAGVIAAEVNGVGITGIAPGARIMNLRACDNGSCWSFDTVKAILYAVDMGADIINLSFGGPVPEAEGDPPLETAIQYAESHGVLVVTAAGNDPPGALSPGEIMVPSELPYPNNLSVAATDRDDALASFSYYSPNIDIAAPGTSILSTTLSGYATVSGTSFSAPLAAGAAALLLSADPALGYEGVIEKLMALADHPSAVNGKVASGRLNAGRALTHKFIDTVGHLFESDISWAAAQGITKGCNPPTNTKFCPDNAVTREVMAAFLVRALSLPGASKDYFTDDNGSIFEADINAIAEAGITKGCNPPDNTKFCPQNVVDRGQMAAFLVRALGLVDNGGGDLFVDDDGSIFEAAIDKLGTAGITKGCNPPENTMFCPTNAVDRGAMAAFLRRALG
jgi:subtilisin family serine protease